MDAVAAHILGFVYPFSRPRAESTIVETSGWKENEKPDEGPGVRDQR